MLLFKLYSFLWSYVKLLCLKVMINIHIKIDHKIIEKKNTQKFDPVI